LFCRTKINLAFCQFEPKNLAFCVSVNFTSFCVHGDVLVLQNNQDRLQENDSLDPEMCMENSPSKDADYAASELRRIPLSQGLFVRAGFYLDRKCIRPKDAGTLLQDLAKDEHTATHHKVFVRHARVLYEKWKGLIGDIQLLRQFLKASVVWSKGGRPRKPVSEQSPDGATGTCRSPVSVHAPFSFTKAPR
jgi:hypothetical protein